MSTIHLPHASGLSIPIDTALFSGFSQVTGQAANLAMRIVCMDNGYTLDQADGNFRTGPATPNFSMAAMTDYPYDYSAIVTQQNWPRGYYRALITDSANGAEFFNDFTIGIFVTRSLNYSAVYDGTNLTLSVWVEENGVAQTDYTSLASCNICDKIGNVISGGALGNNSSPSTNGVFTFTAAVALSPSTNYIFMANATVCGPATRPGLVFPLRIGIARP